MVNKYVSSIMFTNVITAKPTISLSSVKDMFDMKLLQCIAIVDDLKFVGLITRSDLYKLSEIQCAFTSSVKNVIPTKITILASNTKIETAAEILLDTSFYALPVVNNKNELVGIITKKDILRHKRQQVYRIPRNRLLLNQGGFW